MTMNVNMSANTRLINLIVLALAALGILFKSSITFTYFNHTINKVDMWMKVGSTTFHWSQIAVLAINKSETNEGERFKELMLIWAVFAIVLLGLSIFMMSWREKRVQRRLLLCNNPVSTDRSLGNSSLSMSSSNDRLDGRD
jgi:HAMP domain-containing protein